MLERILKKFEFTKNLISKNQSLQERNEILKEELEHANLRHIEGFKKFEAKKREAENATALAALLIAEPHFMYLSRKSSNYIVLNAKDLDKYKHAKINEQRNLQSISFRVDN